jgi:hypothetical protein
METRTHRILRILAVGAALQACETLDVEQPATKAAPTAPVPPPPSTVSRLAAIRAGEIPPGQTWTGVYFNPVYGYLHLVEQGGDVVGRWKRTDASHWGELDGAAEGNVVRFAWREHPYEAGAGDEFRGTGRFVFTVDDNGIPELDGEYATDGAQSWSPWHLVKQTSLRPTLMSVP